MKRKNKVHKKHHNETQTYLTNGLYPPQGLEINFRPSPKQYELWKCLEPNSCNLCGGEIIRKTGGDEDISSVPVCEKCGNDNIPQMILGGGAAGGGKMLSSVKSVMTPNGEVMTKDIKVGDVICSTRNSGLQTVTYLHPIETHKFYRVDFEDGTHTECSEGHLWTVWQTRRRSDKTMSLDEGGVLRCHQQMETRQMFDWLEKKKNGMYKGCNLKIPLVDPVVFTKYEDSKHRPIHPYVLGVILGDGTITESNVGNSYISISNGDKFILDKIDKLARGEGGFANGSWIEDKNCYSIYFNIPNIKNKLIELGIYGAYANSKFIPDVYKYAPIEDRFLLMQGLMDTDGHIDRRGHFEYSSASSRLASDVAYVSRSLGSYAKITVKKKPTYTYNGEKLVGQASYRIYIRSPHSKKMVSLPKKKNRCKDGFNGGKSPFGKVIRSIEPIGDRTSRCITVSDPSGEYVTDDFNVTHNSYVGCAWILIYCMRFPRINAVIARKTLKSLTESTWKTLLFIMDTWGLVENVHYKSNNTLGTITLWNGSQILKKELELRPGDPDFQRLGSSEYTIAFIDEVSEISRRGVETLYSRLRWKVHDTFKVPKMFMSTNPTDGWIRDRFVQDKYGQPVKTRKYEKYVPFSVFDNPDKEFVEVYASSLSNMDDEDAKQRLLYGNWDFMKSSDTVLYKQFDGEKHLFNKLFDTTYDPTKPLIFVFDFNVIPQMSVLVCQIDYENKEVYILRELEGTPAEKRNSTPAMARVVRKFIQQLGHTGGIIISGDPSGRQRSTATEVGVNNYTIIEDELSKNKIRSETKLLNKTPPQKTRIEFINSIFTGEIGWKIKIDLSCRLLTSDLQYQEQNPDGTKCKRKVTDPETGMRYERYGHFSDNLDYLLTLFLDESWNNYLKGDASVSFSPNAIISVSPRGGWDY